MLRLIRQPVIASLACICTVLSAAQAADAQRLLIPREHHPWGAFNPGSWIQVRKLTEEFDERGQLKSVSTTETKTTLVEVVDRGYTLQLEVTVEVAGKRIVAQPRTVYFGFYGETNGQRVVIRLVGEDDLTVGEKKVKCQIFDSVIQGGDEKILSKIHYCDSTAPFVLRRDTKSTDLEGKTVHLSTQVDAIAVEMPHRVVAEIKTAAHVRTVKKHAKGSTYTLEVHCDDVPGGIVSHASKEMDDSGRLVRRSTLDLLDYGAVARKRLIGRPILPRRRSHKTIIRVAPPR